MTVTDQRPVVDPGLIDRARELVQPGRPLPSKRELQKHLGKGWDTVNAVLSALTEEAERQAAAARLRARRGAAKKRRTGQRRRRVNVCFPGVNGPATAPSPKVAPEPAAEATPEAVQEHPKPTAPAKVRTWPILIIAAGAFVAVWAGWVGLGGLTGFGLVNLLPGLVDDGGWATIDTRITLPASMEAYSAYAFYVLLHRNVPKRARTFAAWSAGLAVLLGMGAQVAYHQMIANGVTVAPAWVISVVSCIPVATFALGAALRAMVRVG
jgi:uncharacterized RDD family membrane protein YckC